MNNSMLKILLLSTQKLQKPVLGRPKLCAEKVTCDGGFAASGAQFYPVYLLSTIQAILE